MALTQHTVTVTPNRNAGMQGWRGSGTWTSGLTTPKLISAVPVLPTGDWAVTLGVNVRARLDADVVTVEVSGPINGPIDVLVTVDA